MGVNQRGTDAFGGTLANWTEVVSGGYVTGWSIETGAIVFNGGAAAGLIYYDAAQQQDADQYGLVKMVSVNYENGLALRYTSPTSVYLFVFDGGTAYWYGPDYDHLIASTALVLDDGDVVGVTVSGTGNDTVVRIWKNPTGTSPDSVSSWGSDTTPDVTFTDNPATPVDSGAYAGLLAYTYGIADDFYFGDFAEGAIVAGAGSFAAASTVSGTAKAIRRGAGTLAGAGAFSGAAKVTRRGAGTIAASSAFSGTGKGIFGGASTLAAQSSVSAIGKLIRKAASSLAALSAFTATGRRTTQAAATITAISTAAAVPRVTRSGAGSVAAQSTVEAVGRRTMRAAATIAAQSAFEAIGSITREVLAAASLAATSAVSAAGKLVRRGVAAIAAASSVSGSGKSTLKGAGQVAGASTVQATARRTVRGIISLAAQAVFSAAGTIVTYFPGLAVIFMKDPKVRIFEIQVPRQPERVEPKMRIFEQPQRRTQ
jgi:hypothetical protein